MHIFNSKTWFLARWDLVSTFWSRRSLQNAKIRQVRPICENAPETWKNDENTPALKMQSQSGTLKFWLRQPPYIGIRILSMKFGVIPTLYGKVALFTQTEETECVNNKIVLLGPKSNAWVSLNPLDDNLRWNLKFEVVPS